MYNITPLFWLWKIFSGVESCPVPCLSRRGGCPGASTRECVLTKETSWHCSLLRKSWRPVDFSGHASRALVGAAELAAHFGSRLYALHVVAPVPVMAPVDIGDFGLGAPAGPIGGLDIRPIRNNFSTAVKKLWKSLSGKRCPPASRLSSSLNSAMPPRHRRSCRAGKN